MNSNALLLLILQALVWSSYMFSVPLLPPYASKLNLTKDLIGLLLSSYTLTFILSTIFLAKYLIFLNKFKILYFSLISLGKCQKKKGRIIIYYYRYFHYFEWNNAFYYSPLRFSSCSHTFATPSGISLWLL